MNRMIPAGCLAVLCLNGCHLPPDNTAPTRKYGAASDVAVARHAQYQLWGQGIYSAALPERQSGGSLKAHSDRVSFDWEAMPWNCSTNWPVCAASSSATAASVSPYPSHCTSAT